MTPNTHLAFTVYDLGKPKSQSLLASTVIDVFDRMTRMRQGTFDLFLWPGLKPDMSVDTMTPGLFDEEFLEMANQSSEKKISDETFGCMKEINQLLQRIHFYEKKEKI